MYHNHINNECFCCYSLTRGSESTEKRLPLHAVWHLRTWFTYIGCELFTFLTLNKSRNCVMASIFCCFRSCANAFDLGISAHTIPIKRPPLIVLDSNQAGKLICYSRVFFQSSAYDFFYWVKFLFLTKTENIYLYVYTWIFCHIISFIGQEVVLLKNGMRICGTGGALGNTPIMQDKSYFEVRIQQTGMTGNFICCVWKSTYGFARLLK